MRSRPPSFHIPFMLQALTLAEKGGSRVSPNPKVGACVVYNGKIAGKGFHAEFGGPHAEVNALRQAGQKARGSTLYVTLEPCSSWGKTPPCVQAILEAGVKEVVLAVKDPNPLNSGKGIQALKKAGLKVVTGICEQEARELNSAFFKRVLTKLPLVTLKMAQTLDGKIASVTGSARWISSKASREFVHRLRAGHDAILVGKNTLYADNPFLSPRLPKKQKENSLSHFKPWRVAIDPEGQVSPQARIFKGSQLTFIAVSEKKLKTISRKKTSPTANYLPVREIKGRLDLKDLLHKIAKLGAGKLLVEGGGELAWSLLREGLVDQICWIVAPKFLGGRNAKSSVEGDGFVNPNKALNLKNLEVSKLGEDWLFEGRL